MGRSNFSLKFSVLLLISVLWKPVVSDKCSLACKGAPTSTTFLTGHKYNYGVEGTVSIYLTGADKQETSVKLLAQVSVTSHGNCVNELSVQHLAISGPDGKKYEAPSGIEKAVLFTLQDGRAGSEICAEEHDTRRSLNIKRAIISLLQTEEKSSTQTDVFGVCPTDASSSKEGSAVLIHRSRDLSRCGHREQGRNDLVYSVSNPTSEIKSTRILRSALSVESKVNNGVPEKVAANEEYLYKPFSVGENGARAKVHTKLTLTGKAAAGAQSTKCTETRTIIFENPHGETGKTDAQSVLAVVKETAKNVATEANSKSAGIFAQLVRITRTATKDDLVKVFSQVKNNKIERRVFLDALFRSGTGASIEAAFVFHSQKAFNDVEEAVFFLTLSGARHVTDSAIKAAANLIGRIKPKYYAGLGALTGVYCRDHNCHAGESSGVSEISQKFGSMLNCRTKGKDQEDTVVHALRGIRNIRHLEDSLIDKVVRCASDAGVKQRVRVAALEAFLADPCAAKVKKAGIDIMKNRQLDSEIRIKAYLAVIGCPCGGSANEIKKLLEDEPVHQVGRFISSSLRYIRSSANPDKLLARQHYGLIRTPNKFNVDNRKYSLYRESSFNVDALGLGGNVEETVIYSQDSFLPRSASLNLTAEVFGHNMNILEVGGRQGNLDRFTEHLIGPKGLFRNSPIKLFQEVKKAFSDAKEQSEAHLNRGRRAVKTDVDNFAKHMKEQAEPFNSDLELDIYMKMFGSEVMFYSFGHDEDFHFHQFVERKLKYGDDLIEKLKNYQRDHSSNLLFMDTQLAYPTATGLPLKLDLLGSSTVRLNIAANIDIRQIIRSPESAKVDVKLVPSADIEIAGLFLVDADAVATGLKVVTNLHSSTGGHIVAKVLENGNGFDLQMGLPIDKQEILTASNDLVYFTAEKGQLEKYTPLKIDAERKEYTGCFDQLSGLLGLTFCGELSVPFSVSGPDAQASVSKFLARYPLSGPSKVKLVLEKNDLRGYHIKGIYRATNERRNFELLFEAEGSKNRRTQVTGEIVNSSQEKSVTLSLESPIKTLYGQMSLHTSPSQYAVVVKGKMDQAQYFGRAGFNVQGNSGRSVFKPVLEYELPEQGGKKSLKVDGEIVREIDGPTTKYTFQKIKLHLPNSKDDVDINGHFNKMADGVEIDIKAKQGEYNALFSGSKKGHDVNLELRNNLNPNVNFKLTGHFEKGPVIHNDFDLTYGGDLTDPNSRIIFNQFLKYHIASRQNFNVITKNKFEVLALPLKIKADAEADPKKLDIDVEGQYFDKKGNFKLESRKQIKTVGDYLMKMSTSFDQQGVEVFSKRDIVSADKSNFENYIDIKNVGKYELSGVVLHKTKPNDMNVGAIGHLKVSGGSKNEDIKFDLGAIENSKVYSSHAKISYSKGEFLDYFFKIVRGANPSGQLKLNLKDTLAASGQFKVTDTDGKGNGMVIVDFKKSQRKIRGDVKFVAKEPVFNAEVDLFLNFEKDNNDKVHFGTNTKTGTKMVDSKNFIQYGNRKAEVNVRAEGGFEGKSSANVEVVLPTERCLTFKMDREFQPKGDVHNGHVDLVLSDATKRGGPASKITYKAKIIDSDTEKGTYQYEGQAELVLKDGKKLTETVVVKNVPEGDQFRFHFQNDLTGNLIPKPAHLVADVLYSNDEEHNLLTKSNVLLKGNYGDDYSFEVKDNVFVTFEHDADKKYDENVTATIRLPFQQAHDIKYNLNVFVFRPAKQVQTEYNIINSIQVNADLYKVDFSGKAGTNSGYGKVKVLVPKNEPFALEGSYKASVEGAKKEVDGELKAQYGKGKSASVAVNAKTENHEHSLNIKTNAPQAEKLKKVDFSISTKSSAPNTVSAIVIMDADGRVYKSETLVVYSKANPVVDIKYTSPKRDQPSRLFLKGTSLSSTQGKVEINIQNIRDMSLDVVSEGTVQKDNIAFKIIANSEKLGYKNAQIDISSKDAGNGKRLEFNAVNNNENILSGSTSFISKQEGSKTIYEGSGSVKVKNDQKPVNFKYIRTILTEGNEQGVETFLNMAFGERSYVAESRVTNLEFKNSYVYCEEKKQCANAELISKLNTQKAGVIQHVVSAVFDLRKLGITPELGLEINSEMSENKLPQYSLDLYINKEDKKYHMQLYSKPAHGHFPAGITVTLPSRVLALEAQLNYPTDKGLPFPMKGELVLHSDKNKPQYKSAARFAIDVTGVKHDHTAFVELGFSHPKLGREALIKVQAKAATVDKHGFRYESTASISHPTLGGNRESKLIFEGNPTHIKLYIATPIVKVIDLEGSATVKDQLQEGSMKFSLLEGKPVQVNAIIKDYQYYEFTTDESGRKLSIVGHIEPTSRIDISADIILEGEKKNIFHGAVFTKDDKIKSDYGANKDNIKYFVNAVKKDLENLKTRVKELGEKANNDFKATMQKVKPTLNQLEQTYKDDIQKLYQEIANDKVLKEMSESLDRIAKYLAKMIDEVIQATAPIVDQIKASAVDILNKVKEMYKEKLEAEIKQLYMTVSALIKEYFDALLEVVAHVAAMVSDFLEKHKAEIQELTNTFAEIFQDIGRIIIAQVKEFRAKAGAFFEQISAQIKDLPIFEMIKEKYKEMAVPDVLLDFGLQFHNAVQSVLPTQEAKDFSSAVYKYLEKKRLHQKMDENAEIRVLYQKFTKAVSSLIQMVRAQLGQFGVPNFLHVNPMSFFSDPRKTHMPSLGHPPTFSFLSHLIKGDIRDPQLWVRAYRPNNFQLIHEIPKKMKGVIVNGQHIFTFDGRHLTFPGTCRYILAHDYVDRNFTVVMQLQNGAPKAVALVGKTGKTVEVKDNGQVTLDGQAHPLPVMDHEDVFAYREAKGHIVLGSTYGVKFHCTPKLEICYFEVSGFYHGKLRGLLGDGNNEPFDDFRLPSGKISQSENEFGNAYRLASSCPQVKTPEHSHHQMTGTMPAACEKVFGTQLKAISYFQDMAPFRQACVHAVSGDSEHAMKQACDLAQGYVYLSHANHLPAVVPNVCVTCTDADKPKNVGDTYEIKLPNKQADIIVNVETTVSNEKTYAALVVPLVSQLVDTLKSKHFSDIKVYLVGITPKFPYPIIYDTDSKLKNPKVQFNDKERYGRIQPVDTGCPKFDHAYATIAKIVDALRIEFGFTNVVAGYATIFKLPLRPGAVKHAINVVGEHCKPQFFALSALRSVVFDVVLEEMAYTHSLITVTPDMKVGDGKNPAQVVGFTDDSVIMLGDRKMGKDTETLRSTLELADDGCVDFVESTEGLVFSSTNFHANPSANKQFLQTAVGAIVQKMTKETLVQECMCSYQNAFSGRSVCFNKERKDAVVARRRK